MTQSEVEAITRGIIPVLRRHVDEHVSKAVATLRIENEALQRRVFELEELLTAPGGKS